MKKDNYSFQPVLKSKYLIILALFGVLAIMSPSYVSEYNLWITYVIIGFNALVTFGLYQNIRFQKLHKKLRPFIVARVLQVINTFAFIALLASTGMYAIESGALIPFSVYYLLALATLYQFYSIFRLAKRAKEDFPDRCEFC